MKMTFRQLSYVVEISKSGSINKAAHNLFISQTGISASVHDLEEELGICLFNRTNRGVEFTPEGKEFLSYAISLVEQKQRVERLYSGNKEAAAPTRFSVSTQRYPFTEAAFLQMLQQSQESNYRFSIKETGMDTVIDDIFNHQADIGVIFLTELNKKMVWRMMTSREIEFHELAVVPPCVFVKRSHPLVGMESVDESVLSNYPYVSFEHSQGVAVDFSEEYQLLWSKRPTRCITVNNRTSVYHILLTTNAFTTGSGLLVRDLNDSRVISIPLEERTKIHLGWIKSKNSKSFSKMDEFISLLENSVADSIQYTEEMHRQLAKIIRPVKRR